MAWSINCQTDSELKVGFDIDILPELGHQKVIKHCTGITRVCKIALHRALCCHWSLRSSPTEVPPIRRPGIFTVPVSDKHSVHVAIMALLAYHLSNCKEVLIVRYYTT